MNNLQLPKAPENKYLQSAEYSRKIETAYHRMRPRIFSERFKNLNIIAQFGIFLFPVISIITGISFIYGHLESTVHSLYISIALSVVLLAIVELVKNHLLTNALETFFSNSGKVAATFAFAFMFSALSFIMSFNGAAMLVKNLDSSKQVIKDNTSAQLASIDSSYNVLIKDEQRKIDEIKAMAAKQWKKLLTTSQTDLLKTYEGNIQHFRIQMEKDKDNVTADKKTNLTQADTDVAYNSMIFKVFAAIIEIMLILSITFHAFYDFKIVRENIDLSEFHEDPGKFKAIEPNKLPNVQSPPQIQAPTIGLNTGSERHIIKGFFNDVVKQSPLNDNRITVKSSTKRNCKNCGNEFDYKHWNKQYCSDDCRIEYWEGKTGIKLQLKKKQS